ncbi:MAG: hypothetical protein ACRCUE_00970, partial [Bosea sp. (in: a-proteobacteria)]
SSCRMRSSVSSAWSRKSSAISKAELSGSGGRDVISFSNGKTHDVPFLNRFRTISQEPRTPPPTPPAAKASRERDLERERDLDLDLDLERERERERDLERERASILERDLERDDATGRLSAKTVAIDNLT